MNDKYLMSMDLQKTSKYTARLSLHFTQYRTSDLNHAQFQFSMEFFAYQSYRDNLWSDWSTAEMKLDSNRGFYSIGEVEILLRTIRKSMAPLLYPTPQSLLNVLGAKDFRMVYADKRTGMNVDKLEQLDCVRYNARAKNPENGNFISIGKVLAKDAEDARSKIAKELIGRGDVAFMNSWMDNDAEVYESNADTLGEFWMLTVDQMINWPSNENAITKLVEKADANA